MTGFSNNDTLNKLKSKVAFDLSYILLISISGVLAAVALLTSSVPVLIGSMVVAPTLPPLALISIALFNREFNLVWKGAWIVTAGLLIAVLSAILTTWLMNITNVLPPGTNLLQKPLLEERVHPGWFSVVAAFAAGIAGMIATVDEKVDALVGVVAALALVPAAAAGGIALISRDPSKSLGGFGLLGINIALIILTGYITLLFYKSKKQD